MALKELGTELVNVVEGAVQSIGEAHTEQKSTNITVPYEEGHGRIPDEQLRQQETDARASLKKGGEGYYKRKTQDSPTPLQKEQEVRRSHAQLANEAHKKRNPWRTNPNNVPTEVGVDTKLRDRSPHQKLKKSKPNQGGGGFFRRMKHYWAPESQPSGVLPKEVVDVTKVKTGKPRTYKSKWNPPTGGTPLVDLTSVPNVGDPVITETQSTNIDLTRPLSSQVDMTAPLPPRETGGRLSNISGATPANDPMDVEEDTSLTQDLLHVPGSDTDLAQRLQSEDYDPTPALTQLRQENQKEPIVTYRPGKKTGKTWQRIYDPVAKTTQIIPPESETLELDLTGQGGGGLERQRQVMLRKQQRQQARTVNETESNRQSKIDATTDSEVETESKNSGTQTNDPEKPKTPWLMIGGGIGAGVFAGAIGYSLLSDNN